MVSCEDGYEPTIAKNRCRVKVEGLIAFTIEATPTEDESSTVKLTLNSGCDGYVDWGDGTAQDVSTSSVSHTYTEGGTYEIKLGASISKFALSTFTNAKPISLQQLNLATVTDMSYAFNGRTTITGSIPELPPALENGYYAFKGCSGLNGAFPTKLSDSLVNGEYMFFRCSNLTGNVPELPDTLENGAQMFNGCTNLDGTLPDKLPENLTIAYRMFYGLSKLTGNVPEFGSKLTNGSEMFYSCSGLTGVAPTMPSSLTSYTDIFTGTQITNNETTPWPDGAWY